ncbi:MAG: hypothetical protein WKG32_07765 [Gemmatimonadaceae bacterium]
MRTTRSGRAFVAAALAALVAAAHALPAQQRDAYPATLQFGTGLINIPVAWVSPNNADAWLQMSGKTINHYVDPSASNISTKWNTNISLDAHFLGRFSVGASAYSQNPEYGFFGQVLAIRPNQFGYVPGIALGIRNVGKFKHEDRLLVGHDIALNPADSTYDEMVSVFSGEFDTSPTLYGVATQEFRLASWGGSLSVGYGNGLFSEDGGLGKNYNAKGQIAEGLFLGGRVVGHPSLNTTLTILAENDGWDWNAGIVADWRGISLGVYGSELEEGSRDQNKCDVVNRGLCRVYNYSKLNLSLGYNGNIIDISRGVLLRTRITDLTREQQRLRAEVAARERRIRGLEVSLRQAQAGELAEIARRRQELERQITEERDAIRRATERLQQLERNQRPPTPPPPTRPPTTSPLAGVGSTPSF